jgi:hypothetical protein
VGKGKSRKCSEKRNWRKCSVKRNWREGSEKKEGELDGKDKN